MISEIPNPHRIPPEFHAQPEARGEVVTQDLASSLAVLGEDLAARQRATHRDATAFSVIMEGRPKDLRPALPDEIYWIAAEALRNAFHYARARRIEIEIRYGARQFRLRVRDDGIGIDAGLVSREWRAGHRALRGMRERARRIGGRLEVWAEQDAGTEVELTIPWSAAYAVMPAGVLICSRARWGRIHE